MSFIRFTILRPAFTPRLLLLVSACLCTAVAAVGAAFSAEQSWFSFDPEPDQFGSNSAIDLRFLNESFAGEHGFISVSRIDPLIHYAGRADVEFSPKPGPANVANLGPLVDHAKQTVTSN